jgi:Helicase conserved C-terminal domain.
MDLGKTLRTIEEKTMAQLKDFQCATVERIDELFRHGQNRVLVADEVGLGKTLIARGAIAKTALIQYENNDDIFKIVYICSNQVIVNQNIQKLDVFNIRPDGNSGDARLSMQHLKIAEQEYSAKKNKSYAQLIPLTPSTSFSMTNGGGTKEERALMYVVLKRIPALQEYLPEINTFVSQGVQWWDWYVNFYDEKVQFLDDKGTGYPGNVIEKIEEFNSSNHIYDILIRHVEEIENGEPVTDSDNYVLQKLRRMFAEISVGLLQPDLVIMDEFQRFKSLIDAEALETENGVIAKKFFETVGLKVLLLSATPYKLYSTMEEIEEADAPDEYYKEFFQVIEFLLNDKEKMNHFSEVWSDYSVALREVIQGDAAVLHLKKKAEDEMYGLMCRTERISVMDTGDYIDDSSVKNALSITEGDIHTYLDMGRMLSDIGEEQSLLVDYAKSTPYLMSYMNHYKVKERVGRIIKRNPEEVSKTRGKYLWINRNWLENYGELPANNARLEELKRQIFNNRSELYMWVPPSRPYYNLEGVYKDSKGFSKILVFSSWEMVPKMIGSMISYEEERRTVGVLSNDENLKSENNKYFTEAKLRYPPARLRFNVSKGEPRGMYMFCLLYPSETLAEVYKPIDYLNAGYSLSEIREELKLKIEKLLRPVIEKYEHNSVRDDKRWYYMAPALLDGPEYVSRWINDVLNADPDADDTTEEITGTSGLETHLRRMNSLMNSAEMGRVPSDLSSVLADMAIGSFAVCAFRANGGDLRRSSELAKVFVNRFNATEATAAIILAYGDNEDSEGDGHWRNVLRYCCDGGFGAMLDEYVHMVSEGAGFGLSEDKNHQVHELMIDALKIHSASYFVDTYPAFKKRMQGEKYQRTFMRSHYAVGFTKSEGSESKNVDRKDSIRNAFNSPMRPFVLATTSIGQEGLDFHHYCRKIMHWNLPGNPIDLEQREGRINRYKCLAIRQDIAGRFADRSFNSDVWQELFSMAAEEIRSADQSELVPYWCLGKNQTVKIERIIPMYPVSKDEVNYRRLIKVLSLYRLTMGQARQEELVDYILESGMKDRDYIKNLFINLSPYVRTDEAWKEKMAERKPVVEVKKKSERQMRIEALQNELQVCEEQLASLKAKKDTLKSYEIVGMLVTHKSFGEGLAVGTDRAHITVEFDVGEKTFLLPQAFEKGFLTSEYPDFLESINKNNEIDGEIKAVSKAIEEKKEQLANLII